MEEKGIVSQFEIGGMNCAACASRVEQAASTVEGVQEVNVNLLTNSMRVVHDDLSECVPLIEKAVNEAGYQARFVPAHNMHPSPRNQQTTNGSLKKDDIRADSSKQKASMIVSVCLSAVMMLLMMPKMLMIEPLVSLPLYKYDVLYALTSLLLVIPIIVLNRGYFIRGFKALMHLNATMDSLIALGCSASFIYSLIGVYVIAYSLSDPSSINAGVFLKGLYFDSVAMILTLVSVGKYFESRARVKTSKAFEKLASITPSYAYKIINGEPHRLPAEEVAVSDVVMVKKGDAFPVDGVVIKGEGSVDEATLTGEPLPRDVSVGDKVFAGTINCSSVIFVEAIKVQGDTMIDRIVDLLYDANATKAPIQRLSDKIARIFVPAVIGIAAVTFLVWFFVIGEDISQALIHAVSVLVISCPCALGLATPTAIMVGTGRAATQGILFKSAEALQECASVDIVFFDKTGTITQGHPSVRRAFIGNHYDEKTVMDWVVSLESLSSHPLSYALSEFASAKKGQITTCESFKEISGKGVWGIIEGREITIGNLPFILEQLEENGRTLDEWIKRAAPEATTVFVASNGNPAGCFEVIDPLSPAAREVIAKLHDDSIKTILLTGDNEICAREVSQKVGIDSYHAQVLPVEKGDIISKAQTRGVVAMVGDGVNDALALARAQVGIALRSGNDIALDAGDVILMNNSLYDVLNTFDISRKTLRIIKQNLFWALIYNTLCIPLAAGVLESFGLGLNPMIAAFAMSLSSLCVVSNALRLYSWKPIKQECGLKSSSSFDRNLQKTQDVPATFKEDECLDSEVVSHSARERDGALPRIIFHVTGMHCSRCEEKVAAALATLEGVEVECVDHETEQVVVTIQNETGEMVAHTIREAGFEVVGWHEDQASTSYAATPIVETPSVEGSTNSRGHTSAAPGADVRDERDASTSYAATERVATKPAANSIHNTGRR